MADPIQTVSQKVSGIVTLSGVLRVVGWAVLALIVIGGVAMIYWMWRQKKIYNKHVTAFEIVGGFYQPAIRDTAKTVKLGSGGFEILYLRKLKTWKLAYGGRVGKDTYYFFINRDGYWYNGMLSGDIKAIDTSNGIIPIVTTNPSMRAQYTSLEKQIDSLHADKRSWMEKYGGWMLSLGFVLIIGVFAWLIFKEMTPIMSGLADITNKMATLVDKVNIMVANAQTPSQGGLTPVT